MSVSFGKFVKDGKEWRFKGDRDCFPVWGMDIAFASRTDQTDENTEYLANAFNNYDALLKSHAELLEALGEIKLSLGCASNDGKPLIVRESNANHAWWVAHNAASRAKELTK